MADWLKSFVIWAGDSGTFCLSLAATFGIFLVIDIVFGQWLMAAIDAGGVAIFLPLGISLRIRYNRQRRIAENGRKPPTAANLSRPDN